MDACVCAPGYGMHCYDGEPSANGLLDIASGVCAATITAQCYYNDGLPIKHWVSEDRDCSSGQGTRCTMAEPCTPCEVEKLQVSTRIESRGAHLCTCSRFWMRGLDLRTTLTEVYIICSPVIRILSWSLLCVAQLWLDAGLPAPRCTRCMSGNRGQCHFKPEEGPYCLLAPNSREVVPCTLCCSDPTKLITMAGRCH